MKNDSKFQAKLQATSNSGGGERRERVIARSMEDHGATAGKDFGYRRAKHTMPSSEEDHQSYWKMKGEHPIPIT